MQRKNKIFHEKTVNILNACINCRNLRLRITLTPRHYAALENSKPELAVFFLAFSFSFFPEALLLLLLLQRVEIYRLEPHAILRGSAVHRRLIKYRERDRKNGALHGKKLAFNCRARHTRVPRKIARARFFLDGNPRESASPVLFRQCKRGCPDVFIMSFLLLLSCLRGEQLPAVRITINNGKLRQIRAL